MQRAIELAEYGRGKVSPNPLVGCVIIAEGKVIGEGWHKQYGCAHAEVEAISDVLARGNEHRLKGATAYVNLEPCSHYGKTPPCADLLIEKGIKNVVVANEDPNPLVAGRGIERLKQAGVHVVVGVMEMEGEALNKRFFTGIREKRPFIILKWAQSRDGLLSLPGRQVKISHELTDMLVHKWRSEEDAILVGKNTILVDNPALNVRKWSGQNPVRIILDRELATAREEYRVFDGSCPTIFVNHRKDCTEEVPRSRYSGKDNTHFQPRYLQITSDRSEISQMLNKLYSLGVGSVLVEGGFQVLTSFLVEDLWDEIRFIRGNVIVGSGTPAPCPKGIHLGDESIGTDTISYFSRSNPSSFQIAHDFSA